jgi:hypothetical protein
LEQRWQQLNVFAHSPCSLHGRCQNECRMLALIGGWPALSSSLQNITARLHIHCSAGWPPTTAIRPGMADLIQLPVASCWTGSVAVWAPFPQPSQQQQQQQHVHGLPPFKTSSCGVWVRSDAGSVLAVQWRAGAAPLLTCTLRGSCQLVQAPLLPGGFAFRLLCPQHGAPPAAAAASAGSSSGHVLFLSLATSGSNCGGGGGSSGSSSTSQQHWFTAAMRFDTAQAGRECGALLQAAQRGSLDIVRPAPPPPAAVAAGAEVLSAPTPAQQEQQGAAPEGAPAEAEDLFGYADESSLLAAIQVGAERRVRGW